MTRDQMVERMINDDMSCIIQDLAMQDQEFLHAVLSGEGWVPYNQLTDEQVVEEYESRKNDMDDRDIPICD